MMAASVHVLVLLLLLVLHQAVYINAESQNWYKVEVSNTTLDGNTPKGERSVRSVAQCTMVASRDPQNQLLCFRTPGVCTKYDIVVKANDGDSFNGGDDVTLCWTRHVTDLSTTTTTTTVTTTTPTTATTTTPTTTTTTTTPTTTTTTTTPTTTTTTTTPTTTTTTTTPTTTTTTTPTTTITLSGKSQQNNQTKLKLLCL
ncbi:hypothetical protein Pcinc_016314 [Petrolisthes cinctipes]|uniref:Uncharacterized protein n=1 Tax=Petrolisthes cinctipes TaxID=88211 RepID=A0AAE1FSJ8_PETCI|nr:hypothetical protein Pcinc_016314 [Petrolisthes cinctipes]